MSYIGICTWASALIANVSVKQWRTGDIRASARHGRQGWFDLTVLSQIQASINFSRWRWAQRLQHHILNESSSCYFLLFLTFTPATEVEAIDSRGCYSSEWLSVEPFVLKELWAHMETQQFPHCRGDRFNNELLGLARKTLNYFKQSNCSHK